MATNDAKNKQEDPNFTQNHTCIWVRHSGLSISLAINQWLSYCTYIYMYYLGPVRSNQGQGLMQVSLKVKQAPIKHYIPSDKALAWRYIDQQVITHHMFNTQLYQLFACFWGISMYNKLL